MARRKASENHEPGIAICSHGETGRRVTGGVMIVRRLADGALAFMFWHSTTLRNLPDVIAMSAEDKKTNSPPRPCIWSLLRQRGKFFSPLDRALHRLFADDCVDVAAYFLAMLGRVPVRANTRPCSAGSA